MDTLKQLELGLLQKNPTESSDYIYTTQPSGDIDIARLLEGKDDFFKLPAHVTEYKKKNIVIHDPSVSLNLFSNSTGSVKMVNICSDLLKQGFFISVWTDNQLIKITKPSDLMPALKQIKPVSEQQLKEYLATQGLASRDCYLWGVHQTQNTIHHERLELQRLMLLSEPELDSFFASLPNDKIKIYLDPQLVPFLVNHKIFMRYLDTYPVFDLCINGDIDLHKTLPVAKNVTSFYMCRLTDWDTLSILTHFTSLEEFTILYADEWKELLRDLILPATLKKIRLPIKISLQEIAQLFKSCPALEDLCLARSDISGETPNDWPLFKLQNLSLFETNVTWKLVSSLLKSNASLQQLDLSSCDNLGELPEDLLLPKTLKKIMLEGTKMTWQEIAILLKSNPNLEELDLWGCAISGEFPANDLLLSKTLKIINFTRTKITWNDASQFVKSNPSLEELKLDQCDNLGELPSYLSVSTTLKKLDLSNTRSRGSTISRLLQSYPLLEILNVDHSIELGSMFNDLPLHAALKYISLSWTVITWQQVAQLLKACPSVIEISLEHSHLGDFPKDLILSDSLKRIYGLHTTWENLANLLKSNSSIETLNSEYVGIIGELPEDLSFLSKMHYLSAHKNSLSPENTEQIKKKVPDIIINTSDEFALPPLPDLNKITFYNEAPPDAATKKIMIRPSPLDSDAEKNDMYGLKIFDNIDIHYYRYRAYDDIEISKNSVELKCTDVILQECSLSKPIKGATSYTGKIQLNLDDWVALPSLTAADKLISIQTQPKTTLDIAYDILNNFYYIKAKHKITNYPTKIAFVIEADFKPLKKQTHTNTEQIKEAIEGLSFNDGKLIEKEEPEQEEKKEKKGLAKTIQKIKEQLSFCRAPKEDTNLDSISKEDANYLAFKKLSDEEKLQALIAYFTQAKPKMITTDNVGEALLNQLIKENVGVCRHRCTLFLALAKSFSLPARVIDNEIHSYIEINVNGLWEKLCLGGGPTNLIISPPIKMATTLSLANPFRNGNIIPIAATSMDSYVYKLTSLAKVLPPGKKNALAIMDQAKIPAFASALLKQKKSSCFYLPNLNNIKDSQTVIDNDKGCLKGGPSALKKFLTNAKVGDVLFVNWSDYEAEHVGYNSIMDAERKIKGMAIPKGVIVIGILDGSQKMGEDFYSRFRLISECPTKLRTTRLLPQAEQIKHPTGEIRFYDNSWRPALLGQITANNGIYHFAASPLLTAINDGERQIVLRNAPWGFAEFDLFITELLTKRQIEVNGQTHNIPEDFRILRDDTPYSLAHGNYRVEAYSQETSLEGAYVLNAFTLGCLFQDIQSKQQTFSTLPGLIGSHQNKSLTLFVTQTLADLQWARIIHEAEKNHVELHIILAPRVRLLTHPHLFTIEPMEQQTLKMIETNDPDFVCDELSEDAIVIPVNKKTTYYDLAGTPLIKKLKDDIASDFLPGILTKALQAGQKVILKGELSPALAHQLSSVCLNYLLANGEREGHFKNQLIIITTKNEHLDFITSESRTTSAPEVWNKLRQVYGDNALLIEKTCLDFCNQTKAAPFSYTELKSMAEHLLHHPDSNPLKQILRAHGKYTEWKSVIEQAWRDTCRLDNILPDKQQLPTIAKRQHKLQKMLEHSWYVFVAGPSGVGKSSTINQVMHSMGYHPVTLSGSLNEKLKAWLQPGPKRSLFIDEANLYEEGEFDILEGLYCNPPRLLIDGVYYDVPKDNRLFFAGNFGHFHGRQELRFIKRHGNVITFKEFDDAFLLDSIMQPVWRGLKLNPALQKDIQSLFLKAYHHINQFYPAKHPMTARNLQMMIMRYAQTNNAYLAIYDEASGILNQSGRRDIAKWIKEGLHLDIKLLKKQVKSKMPSQIASPTKTFHITKKRANPVRILDNLMKIRDSRIEHAELGSAGTNGLIIEGNPGEGKSFLALAYVRAHGFVDGNELSRRRANKQGIAPHKRYYLIQAGEPEEVKRILIKAFHEGACVIIDEMNTMPLEHLLNSLLSGVTPEGIPAKHPGFFVMGTQNPIHFGKRSAYSDAFLNRFQKLDLKDYSKDDLQVIVTNLMNEADSAKEMVDYYFEARDYYQENKKPAPTPRDLFEKAGNKDYVNSCNRVYLGNLSIDESTFNKIEAYIHTLQKELSNLKHLKWTHKVLNKLMIAEGLSSPILKMNSWSIVINLIIKGCNWHYYYENIQILENFTKIADLLIEMKNSIWDYQIIDDSNAFEMLVKNYNSKCCTLSL